MAYKLMKRIINNARKNGALPEKRAGLLDKLDAFLAVDRLTAEQYRKLVEMMKEGSANE